jgi:uncharacterized protein YjbJ (UPF0337 family)
LLLTLAIRAAPTNCLQLGDLMSDDKAADARKGLLDSVVGKAKEVAGAVTGKDELTEEGQLQQADAQARKDANSREAVADARAREATEELRERTQDAAADKRTAYVDAGRQEQAVLQADAAEKSAADAQAAQQERADRRVAEERAASVARESVNAATQLEAQAAVTERDAEHEHDRLEREAVDAERSAAQLRAEAHSE